MIYTYIDVMHKNIYGRQFCKQQHHKLGNFIALKNWPGGEGD